MIKESLIPILTFFTITTLYGDWYLKPHVGTGILQSTHETLQIPLGNSERGGRQGAHATFKSGYLLGAAIGYQRNCCSVELDYNYAYNDLYRAHTDFDRTRNQSYDLYRGYIQSNMLLTNAFYSFREYCQFMPYFGGGMGISNLKSEQILAFPFFDGTTVDDNTYCFTCHFRIGLESCLTNCFSVDLYYSFYNVFNPLLHDIYDNSFHLKYFLHTVNFGLKYNF